MVAGRFVGTGQRHRRLLLPARDGHPVYLIEPNLRRHDAELHWEQKAGGVMLLAIALVAFFLGVYPQPLLTLVQQAGLAG